MIDWASLGFDPANLPLKICLVGFAPSRVQTPWGNPEIEYWLTNDVYAHTPWTESRCRTFELHSLTGLVENQRRNAQYHEWLRKGKMPVYMPDPQPDFPSAYRFPYELLCQAFPRRYFTNSIAWQQALAILCLTEPTELKDGRVARLARPGAELALYGIDMSAESELTYQRPCCDHYVGVAEAAGIQVFLPDTSDLCKAGALYGLDTTEPLRQKLELKIAQGKQAEQQIDQGLAQLQAQREQLMFQKGQLLGERGAYKYVKSIYTNPMDRVPSAEERAERHGTKVGEVPSTAALSLPNGKVPHPVNVGGS